MARLHSLYDSIPCLPDLLKEEGYATGFFQSSTAYFENFEGRLLDAKGAKGRYVRLYSKGNSSDDQNHYTEVEVYGK